MARLHGPADVRGDLAFLPFGGAGFIVADISDPANIEEIGRLDFTPLFGPTISAFIPPRPTWGGIWQS